MAEESQYCNSRELYEARTKGWAIGIDDVFNIEQQLSGTEAQPQDSQVGNKDQIDSWWIRII